MDDKEMAQATAQGELIRWALKGDEAAVAFCDALFYVFHLWDDLVDGDKQRSSAEINRAMWMALVELPQNPFFSRFKSELLPLLRSSITDWLDANDLEKQSLHCQQLAFVLRNNFGAIVTQCAYIVGGYDWMREVAPAIRAAAHEESLETYLEGIRHVL